MSLDVHFAWDASSDPDVAGYKIYAGSESGFYDDPNSPLDVGNILDAIYTLDDPTGNFYFALTVYNTSDEESAFSNELTLFLETLPEGQAVGMMMDPSFVAAF